MDVSIIPELTEVAADKEYRIEKFHCGGKGGQNVNKVETYRLTAGAARETGQCVDCFYNI